MEVTRVQGGQLAIVAVDGKTFQLRRVAGSAMEQYGNNLQTLNLFQQSATLDSLGRTLYGPCASAEEQRGVGPRRATPRDRD